MTRYTFLKMIISGGQTGADIAGLRAAMALDLQTGGTAPLGYMTEDGPNRNLRDVYDLKESRYTSPARRTRDNVRDSYATVIFGIHSAGSVLTMRTCQDTRKPYLWLDIQTTHHGRTFDKTRREFRSWLAHHKPRILNVAGNRESVNPGIEDAVYKFLVTCLT